MQGIKVGDSFDVSIFETGERVDVAGTSKGKGFAGTIKRHNFKLGPKRHGSHNYRGPGSIGSMFPQHVMKGMRMAGRLGAAHTTTRRLEVIEVDVGRGILLIRGAVPGPSRSLVEVRGSGSLLPKAEEGA